MKSITALIITLTCLLQVLPVASESLTVESARLFKLDEFHPAYANRKTPNKTDAIVAAPEDVAAIYGEKEV